jgi:hypothetical protein
MEEDSAFEIYKLFRGEFFQAIENHRETLQNYLAFAAAVLGATIVGFLQIRDIGYIGAIILTGPILNVSLCTLAIRICDRFYLAFLERVAIIAKLDSALGFLDPVDLTDEGQDKAHVFPEDRYLLPERWIKAGQQYATAEEFIQQHLNAGVNRLARQTFQLLIVVNILLGVAIVLVAFL